jgi:hypothetical protein
LAALGVILQLAHQFLSRRLVVVVALELMAVTPHPAVLVAAVAAVLQVLRVRQGILPHHQARLILMLCKGLLEVQHPVPLARVAAAQALLGKIIHHQL